jgi:hypothetical protein
MPAPLRGDVFAEMRGCLDQGISGRPSLARFVEITYEAILELKRQVDQIHTPHSRLRLERKDSRRQTKSRKDRSNQT